MKPQTAAGEVMAALSREADRAVADQALRFFKPGDRVSVIGLKTPHVRRLVSEVYRRVKNEWSYCEALGFCDLMIARRQLEAKMFGCFLLGRFSREFEPRLLGKVKAWLRKELCDNWAAVDMLCASVTSPLLELHPALLSRFLGMVRSRDIWARRTVIVMLVPFARRGRYLDEIYAVSPKLFGDSEDLIHKSLGWLLREAGKTDMERLRRFLLKHGPAIPRTTLRYAIERFPQRERKRLLTETKVG